MSLCEYKKLTGMHVMVIGEFTHVIAQRLVTTLQATLVLGALHNLLVGTTMLPHYTKFLHNKIYFHGGPSNNYLIHKNP